jgi:hypothetical protein
MVFGADTTVDDAPVRPDPSAAELRAWARSIGLPVSNKGRIRPEILNAWHDAHHR